MFWWVVVAVSGVTSLLASRLANPLAIDDALAAVLLSFIVPAVAVLILGALHRLLGVASAALFRAAGCSLPRTPLTVPSFGWCR